VIRRISLALALASVVATAPTAVQGQTVLGLRAGVNVANVDGDDIPINLDSRVGLNLGGFVSVPFSGGVGVLLGANYSQRGAKILAGDSGEGVDITLELDYIEIPALLTLTFRSDGPLGGRFYAGPAFAFEVSCGIRAESQGVELSADCDQPEDPVPTESFDVGAIGGAGLLWETAGGMELFLDAFYNLGLTSIVDVEDQDAKNRTFTVQAGVGFPL
jgi:hypothetical protein